MNRETRVLRKLFDLSVLFRDFAAEAARGVAGRFTSVSDLRSGEAWIHVGRPLVASDHPRKVAHYSKAKA